MAPLPCPLCGNDKAEIPKREGRFAASCPTCGHYDFSDEARYTTFSRPDFKEMRHLLSGVVRHAQEWNEVPFITSNVQPLLDASPIPDTPIEAMDLILLYVQKKIQHAGDTVEIHPSQDYPISFSKNTEEMAYLLKKLEEINLLDNLDGFNYRLTINGWRHLIDAKKTQPISNQAFVAMWFAEKMNAAWNDGFSLALNETGYKPIRVDLVQHNDKICDRIIAEIRRSDLLVADVTKGRRGVYFEAGFAMGLGIPVIWTCNEEFFKQEEPHFDTRQYNHIVWKDPVDLRVRLVDRIEATLPNRPGNSQSLFTRDREDAS